MVEHRSPDLAGEWPWAQLRRTSEARRAAAGYFGHAARRYASAYQELSAGGHALRARHERVLDIIGRPRGRVLDVGCGPGHLAQALFDRGIDVWGVDATPAMIEACRGRFAPRPAAHFTVGDAARLAFSDGAFEAAICLGVMDYIPVLEAAVRELIRVVRPGGSVLVSFPNLLSPYAVWKLFVFYPAVALLRPAYYRVTGRPSAPFRPLWVTKMQTLRRVVRLMQRCGAAVADVRYYNFNIFLSPVDELIPPSTLRVLGRLERLHDSAIKWLGAGFIVRAIKAGGGDAAGRR